MCIMHFSIIQSIIQLVKVLFMYYSISHYSISQSGRKWSQQLGHQNAVNGIMKMMRNFLWFLGMWPLRRPNDRLLVVLKIAT